MSNRDKFLTSAKSQAKPQGMEWFASVLCQTCNERVDQQTYYPEDSVLYWECSAGHRSMLEKFDVL